MMKIITIELKHKNIDFDFDWVLDRIDWIEIECEDDCETERDRMTEKQRNRTDEGVRINRTTKSN